MPTLLLNLASGCLLAAGTVVTDAAKVPYKDRDWPAILTYAQEVKITSSKDGTPQPSIWRPATNAVEKAPLLVVLHSWSYGYQMHDPAWWGMTEAERRGWAFLYPDFRGPNKTPAGCGSDLAVADIADAVRWAVATGTVDPDRVYLLGGSGGGHMALLMAGRHPELFAAVYAACPISDLARWHRDSGERLYPCYAEMMTASCGGTPDEKPSEYANRSPVTHLPAARGKVPVDICTGIHDGHKRAGGGSVPCGHAIRAFNCLADAAGRIPEDVIAAIETDEKVPEAYALKGDVPFFNRGAVYLRRQSGSARLTLFEAGHGGNYASAADWFSRQRRGRPTDWSETAKPASAATHAITK